MTSDLVTVYPLSPSMADLAVLDCPGQLGWRTTALQEPECALCQVGCCMQRLSYDGAGDAPYVVHGVLGND